MSFVNNINSHLSPLTSIVCLIAHNVSISVNAIIDSGSAGNFISVKLCHHLKLKKKYNKVCYNVHSITVRPLRRQQVRFSVGPVLLHVGLLHVENIKFLVLENTADIVLGRPWLIEHLLFCLRPQARSWRGVRNVSQHVSQNYLSPWAHQLRPYLSFPHRQRAL